MKRSRIIAIAAGLVCGPPLLLFGFRAWQLEHLEEVCSELRLGVDFREIRLSARAFRDDLSASARASEEACRSGQKDALRGTVTMALITGEISGCAFSYEPCSGRVVESGRIVISSPAD